MLYSSEFKEQIHSATVLRQASQCRPGPEWRRHRPGWKFGPKVERVFKFRALFTNYEATRRAVHCNAVADWFDNTQPRQRCKDQPKRPRDVDDIAPRLDAEEVGR
jgi:hypothetical protein